MSRTPPSYGRRGRLDAANTGIRRTASTYGKAKFGTYSEKASGHLNVESDAERFVAHLLAIDPRVRAFQPQPFCVDLIDQRMLFTKEASVRFTPATSGICWRLRESGFDSACGDCICHVRAAKVGRVIFTFSLVHGGGDWRRFLSSRPEVCGGCAYT